MANIVTKSDATADQKTNTAVVRVENGNVDKYGGKTISSDDGIVDANTKWGSRFNWS